MEDLCRHAFHHLLRRHEVLLDHIYFIHKGQLANFKIEGEYTIYNIRASTREYLSLGFANNTGADQSVHTRILISAFVIRLLISSIS